MWSCRNVQHSGTPQNVPLPDGHCRLINQLPQEILSIIFKYSVDFDNDYSLLEGLVEQKQSSYNDETSIVASQILPLELLVSHVCRLWRNIALETPSLWANISVTNTACLPYERVVAYLERSKSFPLYICIAGGVTRLPSVEADNFEVLLALLVPHLSRWASIQVTVRRYEYMHAFLKAISGPSVPPATRLEELILICYSKLGSMAIIKVDPDDNDLILFGESAPLLRTLALYAVHINWSQAWVQSAPNLRTLHLSLHEMDLRPTSAILLGAPKLQTLKINNSGPLDVTVEPFIHLPNLLELNYRDQDPLEFTWLLRRLCIPVLKTLTLHFHVDIPQIYSDLVTQLAGPATQVTPSSIKQPCSLLRSLETLNIVRLPCSSGSAEILYRELVNLKVLKISMLHMPPSFFDLLYTWRPNLSGGLDFMAPKGAQSGSTVILLPSLKDLFLSGVTILELPTLVMQRRDAGVPLRSISMKRQYETRLSEEVWLRENLEKFEITEDIDDEESEDSDSESE